MRIAVLGAKGTTLDLVHNIRLRGDLDVVQVITLDAEKAQTNKVAHYEGKQITAYCSENRLPLYTAKSYDLKDAADQAFFREAGLDLLLVIGWERIIPDEVLRSLGLFACGMHGSAYGLPKGRGRSPMNWAILSGHTKFITYLFRYTAGIDDGDIIGFKAFDITPYDDISSLHVKNRIAMGELVHTYVPLIGGDSLTLFPQPDEKPTYYPKRVREDGFVDWHQPSETIHRLVRAVSPPYPGAMTLLGEEEIPVRQGQPFDSGLFDPSAAPGTILDVNLSLRRLVVKTGDGAYLVSDMGSTDFSMFDLATHFRSVPADTVLERIRRRYPDWIPRDQQVI